MRSALRPFSPGEAIAWRCHIRTAMSGPLGDLSVVLPMTVVHDRPDEVALVRNPGTWNFWRNAELGPATDALGHHGAVLAWKAGFRRELWGDMRVLIFKRPDDAHAISLFTRPSTAQVLRWYIDLTSPLRRTPFGFDYTEHGLDLLVSPDMATWSWKDEDEVVQAVAKGRYSPQEADELHAEGVRALQRLRDERARFEKWVDWTPDAAWPIAQGVEEWTKL